MNKVLKVIVVGISILLLTLPAYAQEASPAQGGPESAKELVVQESVEDTNAPESAESAEDTVARDTAESAVAPESSVAPERAEGAVSQQPAQDQPERQSAKEQVKQKAAKEQTKGLDEQVQEIKADVLSIATQLNRLEEKLLYPSDTQVAIFVSLEGTEKFRLDAVAIELDGKKVAHHLYTFSEIEALKKGGVQRIHVGNVMTGEHPLHVTVLGKAESGADFQREENFKVAKGIGPKLVGVVLAGSKTITVKDW